MSSTPKSPQDTEGPTTVEPDDVPVGEGLTGPFFQQVGKRKLDGRDAKILVTADHAQTGVGKSNLCDFFAYVFDTTDEGFCERKVHIDPEAFFEAYKHENRGSAMVLEEAEQLDSRRFMSKENVEGSQIWQKGRVREIIALLNLPSPKHIDKRMEELADYWINVEIRGRARIYQKKIHRTKQTVYYETVQILEWPNMDGSETFREMDNLKKAHIDDDSDGSGWIPRDEHTEELEKARKDERKTVRDQFIRSLKNETKMTGEDIAKLSAVSISASQVYNIARNGGDQ